MALMLPIVTYGGGELLATLFNGIAATMKRQGDYGILIHLMLLFSGIWVLLDSIIKRNPLMNLRWLGMYFVVFSILFVPTATIAIYDRFKFDTGKLSTGKMISVDHVPLGLAIMASYTSAIGDGLTNLVEEVFSLPDDLSYNQTGMVMASRLVNAAGQFEITDSRFANNLQEFVQQCVFYDIYLNRYTLDDLYNTADIMAFLEDHVSHIRSFYYLGANGQESSVMTCNQGLSYLKANLIRGNTDTIPILSKITDYYNKQLFPDKSHSTNAESTAAKQVLLTYLQDSYGYLTKLSMTGQEILERNIIADALQKGIVAASAKLNATAAIESYAFAKAQAQKRLVNTTVGEMAAYWLPLLRNTLECILYGSFMLIFLLLLFPFGQSVLKHYLYSLIWLQTWPPLYAIVNFVVSFYAQQRSQALVNGKGLSLAAMHGLEQINADMSGLAGYISMSVPFIAAGLVKGMASTFSQLTQYVGGVVQASASSSASEAISGNISMGNLQYNTQSAFNMSAYHVDTSTRILSGGMSYQMPGGSIASLTTDGSMTLNTQGAISNLGTSINLAETMKSMASKQAEQSYTAGMQYSHAWSSLIDTSLRDLYELSSHQGRNTADSKSYAITTSSDMAKALSGYHQAVDKFAVDHGITKEKSKNLILSAYADASLGLTTPPMVVAAKANIGGDGRYTHTTSSQDRKLYSEAQDYLTSNNLTNSITTALHAAQEGRYQSSTEEGKRLVDSISANYSKALQVRDEANSSFQKAESYRETESYIEDNAVNIQSNANQELFKHMAKTDSVRAIEDMEANDPTRASLRASEFAKEYVESIKNKIEHGQNSNSLGSPNSIQKTYEKNNETIAHQDEVNTRYAEDKHTITAQAKVGGLANDNLVNKDVKQQYEANYQEASSKIAKGVSNIDNQGKAVTSRVKRREKEE